MFVIFSGLWFFLFFFNWCCRCYRYLCNLQCITTTSLTDYFQCSSNLTSRHLHHAKRRPYKSLVYMGSMQQIKMMQQSSTDRSLPTDARRCRQAAGRTTGIVSTPLTVARQWLDNPSGSKSEPNGVFRYGTHQILLAPFTGASMDG
jgi:hypothetical protein